MLAALVIFSTFFGGLTLLLELLNRRDRRAETLRAKIGACLKRELHGMVSISVAVAAWTARARVTLDMRECDRRQTWQVVECVGPLLPSWTTLSIIVSPAAASGETSIRVVGPRGRVGRRQPLGVPTLTAPGV